MPSWPQVRNNYIDRIYDTYIDEEELQVCDATIKKIADGLEPRPYSSREFISEMGKYLTKNSVKKDSLVQVAYEKGVPIFCPAFSDSSAGFGLVKHQWENPEKHVSIDSVKDFLELTKIKMQAKTRMFPCINMLYRLPLPTFATEPVQVPHSRKLLPGGKWIRFMNKWYMPKQLRYYL